MGRLTKFGFDVNSLKKIMLITFTLKSNVRQLTYLLMLRRYSTVTQIASAQTDLNTDTTYLSILDVHLCYSCEHSAT